MEIDRNLSVHVEFFTLPIERKNPQENFCVGCSCCTNFKFLNRHNSQPYGALESKIPSFDSKSKTSSNCILSEKIDLPTLFSFYQFQKNYSWRWNIISSILNNSHFIGDSFKRLKINSRFQLQLREKLNKALYNWRNSKFPKVFESGRTWNSLH